MADSGSKKKYEPPVVREIGGIYEQAMGASACVAGTRFASNPCAFGRSAGGAGCSFGWQDQNCGAGATDGGGCSLGWSVTGGGCSGGFGN